MKKQKFKTALSKKTIFALSFVSILVALVYYSCQKSETASTRLSQEAMEEKFTRENLVNNPPYTVIPMNQKLDLFSADANGNISDQKMLSVIRRHNSNGISGTNGASCFPANGSLPVNEVLVSQAATQPNCGSTTPYSIKAIFTVSSVNPIVLTSPYNSSVKTRGYYKLSNSSGTVLYSNFNITMLSTNIVSNGADPANPGYTKYTITWELSGVPESAYLATGHIQYFGLYFVTSCADEMNPSYMDPNTGLMGTSNYFTGLTQGTTVNAGTMGDCDFVSPLEIVTPTEIGGGYYGWIAGVASTTGCTPTHIPNYQQVQFYDATTNALVWTGSVSSLGTYTFNPTNFPSGVPFVSGKTYNVTYRNLDGTVASPTCTGPWLSPAIQVIW